MGKYFVSIKGMKEIAKKTKHLNKNVKYRSIKNIKNKKSRKIFFTNRTKALQIYEAFYELLRKILMIQEKNDK